MKAAFRFRHPLRWAQAGLPRWLVEHDALDRGGVQVAAAILFAASMATAMIAC
jgi:hypothetical protein